MIDLKQQQKRIKIGKMISEARISAGLSHQDLHFKTGLAGWQIKSITIKNNTTMNSFILKSEDFNEAFLLSEINNIPAGNYNVIVHGGIKHHHHIIVPEDDNVVYYLVAFAESGSGSRHHDDELMEALEDACNVPVWKESVARHESTFRYYVKAKSEQ